MYLGWGGGASECSAHKKKGVGGGAAVNRGHRPGQEKSTFCVIEGKPCSFLRGSRQGCRVTRRSPSTLTVPHYTAVPQLASRAPGQVRRPSRSLFVFIQEPCSHVVRAPVLKEGRVNHLVGNHHLSPPQDRRLRARCPVGGERRTSKPSAVWPQSRQNCASMGR